MSLLPETANPTKSCGICIVPMDEWATTNRCGCPPPLYDGPRAYRLTVEPTDLGMLAGWEEWYGEFVLNNRVSTTNAGCPAAISFPYEYTGFGGAVFIGVGSWLTVPSFTVSEVSGKLYRSVSVRASKTPEGNLLTWQTPNLIPACDNADRFTMVPFYTRVPDDDIPALNPLHPHVFSDYFVLQFSRA